MATTVPAAELELTKDNLGEAHIVALAKCGDCAERRPLQEEGVPADGTTVALALATYELDKTTNKRKGQIVPCTVAIAQDSACDQSPKYKLCPQTDVADLAGVFDIKWSADGNMLASAHADGTCQVRTVASLHEATPLAAAQLQTKDDEEEVEASESCFCLSLDWNDRAGCAPGEAKLAVSRSDGKLSVLAMRSDGLEAVHTWDAHAYPGPAPAEVWITAFDCFDPQVLISGADEAKLKLWDQRVGTDMPLGVCNVHDAGVCSAQFHPRKPNIFATGSYDSHVRIWDKRNLKKPTLEPLDTSGGVWRVKWHPTDDDRLLVAAMRSGFIETKISTSNAKLEPLRFYRDNFEPGRWEALGYGVDWLRVRGQPADLVVGASFYDRKGYLFSPTQCTAVQ
ncbi:Diphthine methyltransferase [Hondaea fermentalgiana]|uniref:methylated diphthine methylhydrolase n=1 Tax=Hondaea fermentalgiana TaxID=2315210 RepID=A0A2R5G5V3_9STRA|nr:Diphthine methyltransferase [Hondaea fermentalgiana]|eukprot:GBG26416.1 Diphthine methyltransferase [Hondaea fermentalgiana]